MIKLLKIGELSDGNERFQSQLLVGRNEADFIRGTDGVMKVYGYRLIGGFDFYEYEEPYQIVNSVEEMRSQIL